jgi:adenylate kinase
MKEKKEQKRDFLPDNIKQNLDYVKQAQPESQEVRTAAPSSSPSPSPSPSPSSINASGYLIFGAPGAGKGTQCELIIAAAGLVHISTGDILREAVKEGTELGKQAEQIMAQGGLVSDDIMIGIISHRLSQDDVQRKGFILDGFPRTRAQAEALNALGLNIKKMFLLEVADEEIVKRVCGRRTDPENGKIYHMTFDPPPPEIEDRLTQRADDTEEIIIPRLQKYAANLSDVRDVFSNIIVHVDATGDKRSVYEQISKNLDEVSSSTSYGDYGSY